MLISHGIPLPGGVKQGVGKQAICELIRQYLKNGK